MTNSPELSPELIWVTALSEAHRPPFVRDERDLKKTAAFVDMNAIGAIKDQDGVPLIYKATLFPEALEIMIEHGVLVSPEESLGEDHTLRGFVKAFWRDHASYVGRNTDTPTPNYWALSDVLVKTAVLLYKHHPDAFLEGKKDVHGRRHLSFLHSVLWATRDDATGSYVMDSLICAGLPVCGDLVGDAPHLKNKLPQTASIVQRSFLSAAMPEKNISHKPRKI